jgi:nucleotide-binding universal stress UspA family protein
MFKHIVVGVDGHEGGRDAVALARLLLAGGGKLTLAYVVARDAHAHRGTSGAPELPTEGVRRRCSKQCAGKRVSKRTSAGMHPLLWDAACMRCAK